MPSLRPPARRGGRRIFRPPGRRRTAAVDQPALGACAEGIQTAPPHEQALGDALAAVAPDWIVCAGYMRILGAAFVQRFNGRLVNIHPSLPLHRGWTRTRGHWRQVMPSTVPACTWSSRAGRRRRAGPGAGTGAAPAMTPTPWLRVLAVEHPLLIATLQLLCRPPG
jgi:phosphoribosylglycinamide formyltransferase-1